MYLTQTLRLSDSLTLQSHLSGASQRSSAVPRWLDASQIQDLYDGGDNEGNRNHGSTSSHLHIFPRWPPIHFHVSRWWNWIRTSTNTASYHRLAFLVSGDVKIVKVVTTGIFNGTIPNGFLCKVRVASRASCQIISRSHLLKSCQTRVKTDGHIMRSRDLRQNKQNRGLAASIHLCCWRSPLPGLSW